MPFRRLFGRYRLEPVMGILTLAALNLSLTQWFIDLLMLTSFRTAQTVFQRFWLCFHFVSLNAVIVVLLYGFSAALLEASSSYHGVTNFRSWLLFVGSMLAFSGFFVVIGYAKDDAHFAQACSRGFDRSAAQHGQGKLSTSDEPNSPVHSMQKCRQIFRALLSTCLLLWTIVQVTLFSLFLCVNTYKKTKYHHEQAAEEEARRQELAERLRQGDLHAGGHASNETKVEQAACPRCQHAQTETSAAIESRECRPPRRVTFDEAALQRHKSWRKTNRHLPMPAMSSLSGMHKLVTGAASDTEQHDCEIRVDEALERGEYGRLIGAQFGGNDEESDEEDTAGMLSPSPSAVPPLADQFPMPPERSYTGSSTSPVASFALSQTIPSFEAAAAEASSGMTATASGTDRRGPEAAPRASTTLLSSSSSSAAAAADPYTLPPFGWEHIPPRRSSQAHHPSVHRLLRAGLQ